MTLNQVVVTDSATAVRVERGAGEVTADGLTVTGGSDGVVALPATKDVVLRNLAADGVDHAAIRTFSPDLQIIDGRISGSTTGIDAGAATTIAGTTIDEVDQGIRARSADLVDVDNVDISALSVGINVAPGSPVRLAGSHVDALEAVRGSSARTAINELSLPPLNLLGAIGVPLILLALVLEQVQVVRQRGIGPSRRRSPPELTVAADMFSWSKRESEHTVARATEPRAQSRGRRRRALAGRRTRRTAALRRPAPLIPGPSPLHPAARQPQGGVMETVVTTVHGALHGHLAEGVHTFLGVPYAAPPFGRNRLRPPQPVEKWEGVRDATRLGPEPPQIAPPESGRRPG